MELQTVAARGASYIEHRAADAELSRESFAALFVVAGSRDTDSEALRERLRLTRSDFLTVVDELQRRYLVDVVSQSVGGSTVETLSLIEEGEIVLQRTLERMCELPELE